MSAPFKNTYICKHVAATDAKSCTICYKSSNAVLITDNSKDWFYVCESHLKDSGFCKVVYQDAEGSSKDKELADLKKEQRELLKKREEKRRSTEKSQFGKIKDLLWKKKEAEEDKDKKEEEKDDTPEKLKEIEDKLAQFQNDYTRYRLDPMIFRNRLMLDYKKQKRADVQKRMQEGTLFPSVGDLPRPE